MTHVYSQRISLIKLKIKEMKLTLRLSYKIITSSPIYVQLFKMSKNICTHSSKYRETTFPGIGKQQHFFFCFKIKITELTQNER